MNGNQANAEEDLSVWNVVLQKNNAYRGKAPVCHESALISVDNCSLYAATLRTFIQENRLKILQQLEKLAEENAKLYTGELF